MSGQRQIVSFAAIAVVVAILFLLIVSGSSGKSVRPTTRDLSFLLVDYVAFLWVLATAFRLLPDRIPIAARKARPHLAVAMFILIPLVLLVAMCGPATGHTGRNPASCVFFAAFATRVAVRWRTGTSQEPTLTAW